VGIEKDSYTKAELMILNKNSTYKIVRMLIKLSCIFFFAIISMFPFSLIFYLFPIELNLFEEITFFFSAFDAIFSLLLSWEMIILIIFSTMVPYILLFIANLNWNPYYLTYSQWNSVLTVIEPTCALLFGVLFVGEYFPAEYLIIVIFLLSISILFRYAHEAHNKINAYILLTNRQKTFQTLPIKLLQFDGVKSVQALVGTHDFLVNVKTTSIRALYYLINERLRQLEGIKDIEILFIDKIIKI
jgi:DNA-binding Lrp family transcriptional regulator